MEKKLSVQARKFLYRMQNEEITQHKIYSHIAKCLKDDKNKRIIEKMASDEKSHAYLWQSMTKKKFKVNYLKIAFYAILNFLFGFTFTMKIMEIGEDAGSKQYLAFEHEIPEVKKIAADEDAHEKQLMEMLDEERLQYVGSMVLGLNDALVELTGTLAGLTFALQNNRLVALSGLITGISATFSMASSEFLSARSEGRKDAFKSCVYTGGVYLFAVICLVLPYLLLPQTANIEALALLLLIVVFIIFIFTFYISVAKGLSFKERFLEMAGISISVAAFSFIIGLLVKKFLGIDV